MLKASTCVGRCFSGNARARTPLGSGNSPDRRDLWEHRAWRPRRQVEHAIEVVGRVEILDRQNRQVLRDAVAEDRSEHAEVVAASVAASDDRFLVDLVGRADTRRPVERVLDVTVQPDAADTRNPDEAGVEIEESGVPRLVHGLRIEDVESQPVVQRQSTVHTPRVLRVVEMPPLPFARVDRRAHVPTEIRHVAKHEARQRQAPAVGSARAIVS